MEPTRFKIVFEQLDVPNGDTKLEDGLLLSDDQARELDEIEALRQIVLEIQDPEPAFYTTA